MTARKRKIHMESKVRGQSWQKRGRLGVPMTTCGWGIAGVYGVPKTHVTRDPTKVTCLNCRRALGLDPRPTRP